MEAGSGISKGISTLIEIIMQINGGSKDRAIDSVDLLFVITASFFEYHKLHCLLI